MPDVPGDLELRPDTRKGALVLAVIAVCGASVTAAILIGRAPAVFTWIAGVAFAAVLAAGVGYQTRSRISVTPDEIVVRGLVFRRRRSRSRVAEAVRATIVAPRGSPGHTLFVLDAHRSVLFRINASGYTREDIDRLVSALGVPCGGPGRAVSPNEFAKEYPGLVSWVERHPYLLGVVLTGILCVVVLTLVLISIASGS